MTTNREEEANKALVLDVVTSVFIKRDAGESGEGFYGVMSLAR